MARWQPNPRERLVLAALELFDERGYDDTTVIQIAERAGLTKSTFFRHFPDKREVLFGGDTIHALLTRAIAEAPPDATALQAVSAALGRVGTELFPADRRAFIARRHAVIAANPELQEREAVKAVTLTAAMVAALRRRAVPDLNARVAAALGALAFSVAYDEWTAPGSDGPFGELAQRKLEELRLASAAC